MANKQYSSIIRLFKHCDIVTGKGFDLSRAKKQLQAEFGITRDGFINVDAYVYSRHDVFEEIDRPDFRKRLVFHERIWDSPQILQLLEKNTANLSTIREEFDAFAGNKEFDEFFSPFFSGPFSYISRNALGRGDLNEMGELLSYEDFLQPGEREEAFRPVRVFLEENLRLLRNTNEENYSIMRPKILHWIKTDWFNFFNNLPSEFYETKNEIITLLVNIGVAVQKSHRADCRRVSEQLMSLHETPESLRKTIVSNHAVYSGRSSSGSFGWRSVGAVVWVIFMLIRLVSSSDGCSSSSYRQYNYPSDFNRRYQVGDSILKQLRRQPVRFIPDTIRR